MRKVSEYGLRAVECRRLASQKKNPEQKQQLEEMAHAWELLARARVKTLQADGTGGQLGVDWSCSFDVDLPPKFPRVGSLAMLLATRRPARASKRKSFPPRRQF